MNPSPISLILVLSSAIEAHGASVIEFTATDFLSDEFAATAKVTLVRQGDTDSPQSVTLTTADDTAKAGEDYESTTALVSFAAGETDKVAEVPIRTDYVAERDETLLVRITGLPAGATSGRPEARVFIRDDERPGSIDASWSSTLGLAPLGPDESVGVYNLIPLSGGKIWINFGVFNNQTFAAVFWRIVLLNRDGTLDSNHPVTERSVFEQWATLTADGRLLVWDYEFIGSAARFRYLLNTDGTEDTTFRPDITGGGGILGFVSQPDGKILVIGAENLEGLPVPSLIRLHRNGTRDATFNAPPNLQFSGRTYLDFKGVLVLPGGQLLVSSENFATGVRKLHRLHQDGSLDPSFSSSLSWGPINAVVAQSNGKVLAGGYESGVRPKSRFVRLNQDGSTDQGFPTILESPRGFGVDSLAQLPGGKVLVSGSFEKVDGQKVASPILLNVDDSRDPAFEGPLVVYPFSDGAVGTISPVGLADDHLVFMTGYGLGRLNIEIPSRSLSPILAVARSAVGFELSLPVAPGQTIGVQHSESLTPEPWLDLGTVTVEDGLGFFLDTDPVRRAKPHGFYRAILK